MSTSFYFKKEKGHFNMKLIPVLGFLLFGATIHAQDMPRRSDEPKMNDSTAPIAPGTLFQERIYMNTPIPDGMVWVPQDKDTVWHAEELNSCEFCAKPTTFKQAAFDKKMSSMWLLEIALTVTDVELGQACLRAGRCKEGNPLMGSGSRSRQYSIRLPVIAGVWMGTAWLRKGDKSYHIGGMKHWYVLPLLYHAASTIGVATGIRR
jgi:hypothetical protein